MNVKTRFFASALAVLMTAALLVPAASAEEAVSRPTLTIGRFDTPPTIDGKFSESEWGEKSFTLAEGQPGVTVHRDKTTDGGGNEIEKPIESTATDVYMGYDDTHVYLCVVAKYKNHKAMALLGSQLWKEDCIQTKIAATPDGPNYNDIDFGINADTNRALGHVWNGHGVTASQLKAGKSNDFMITREGDVTVYEIAYPLSSFATTVIKLKQGDKIAFSMAQHMNAGGFYEYAGGIVMSKEITSAAIVTLGGSKELGGGSNEPDPGPVVATTTARTPNDTTRNPTTTTTRRQDGSTVPTDSTTTASESSASTTLAGDETVPTDVSDISGESKPTSGGESQPDASDLPTNGDEGTESSALGWIIGIIVAVVVIGGGIALYFLVFKKKLGNS